jgi:triosephosphate isomerase
MLENREAQRAELLVLGNWKCTKTWQDVQTWVATFASLYRPVEGVRVVVAPPLIWLARLSELLKSLDLPNLCLAAQDVSPFPPGSYTGATAADMLGGVAEYAIIGHPERRRYFHESALDATNKVSEALDAGIKPIICVDTSYAMSQLTSLHDMDTEDLVIAYCPLDNASYREPLHPDKIREAARFFSQVLPNRPIVYGGGITPDNVREFTGIEELSGICVGQDSRNPERFQRICRAAAGTTEE